MIDMREWLKKARKEKGITQQEFAEMQAECERAAKRHQRTQRLLAAFSKQNLQNEAKNQEFELPYRP